MREEPMARPWSEIKNKGLTPERQARIDERVRKMIVWIEHQEKLKARAKRRGLRGF